VENAKKSGQSFPDLVALPGQTAQEE